MKTFLEQYREATEPIYMKALAFLEVNVKDKLQLTENTPDDPDGKDECTDFQEELNDMPKVTNLNDGDEYDIWRLRRTDKGIILDGMERNDYVDNACSFNIDWIPNRDVIELADFIQRNL